MHVAFLRYTDKMKVLRNAAARLKDNPLNGNVIGISEDFAKKNPKTEARARALQKVSKEETRCRPESLHWIPCNTEICRRKWHRTVGTQEQAKLRREMEEAMS